MAAPKRNIVQMPDEYMPPNKILFIQNLPDAAGKPELEALFKSYPNLHDIRTIPGRKGIAFVEFADEQSSAVAREALHNYKIDDDHKMKVRSMPNDSFLSCRELNPSIPAGHFRKAIEGTIASSKVISIRSMPFLTSLYPAMYCCTLDYRMSFTGWRLRRHPVL